jgi:hypothetical protein
MSRGVYYVTHIFQLYIRRLSGICTIAVVGTMWQNLFLSILLLRVACEFRRNRPTPS